MNVVKQCKCNFTPPHPLRQDNASGVFVGTDYYPEEFFCNFCKGLIKNDMEYIKEVIRFYSHQRWGSISWDVHRDRERELEHGNKLFLDKYNKLLALSKSGLIEDKLEAQSDIPR